MQKPKIEFHIIQSFPVSSLNRDDLGSPKSAIVGGTQRARISSQCWKREVRLKLQELGIKLGVRSKKIKDLLITKVLNQDPNYPEIEDIVNKIVKEIADDTLIFVSDRELDSIASFILSNTNPKDIKSKEISKIVKNTSTSGLDALDISLFGRMVAKASEMDVQASSTFSHAISTHPTSIEMDFFTALDDIQNEGDQGSSHMGTTEFNSATYYRYVSLDLEHLKNNSSLDDEQIKRAIEAFTKALYLAVPSSRQTTFSAFCPWDYARIIVRNGQNLQLNFDSPVKKSNEGYSKSSFDEMKRNLDKQEKIAGSLYRKIASYDFGEDENFSIDDLILKLQSHV